MLFAGPMAANAIPIPVASGVGNGLIVNFDFTGSTLAPPYASIVTTFSLQGLGAGEQVFLDVFAGLNAAPGPNQLIVANASNGLNVDGLKTFSPLPFFQTVLAILKECTRSHFGSIREPQSYCPRPRQRGMTVVNRRRSQVSPYRSPVRWLC